ncbi:MAG: alpha/beta hydrolase-fold protein [Bacteroidota bacterium]|nr:alpha/beta hydrolase-fold protein [Bacteroidota bacterium]
MNREYHKWYSPSLHRDMELLIFGHAGTAVLLFPTRMGRFYDYENWRLVEAIQGKINQGNLQIFCVDSVDAESFYNENSSPSSRIVRHQQYEEYIFREVVPLLHSRNHGNKIIAAGCSLGAYHAVNFAFRRPDLFCKVVGMSGRYDLSQEIDYYEDLLQGFWNEDIYYQMPNQYIPNVSDPNILHSLRIMDIVLVIGKEDPFLGSNYYLSQALNEKGIPNSLIIWEEEAHRACYWRKMMQLYI